MASSSKVSISEGAGKNAATYSFTEDAVTKELQRLVLNTSDGVEVSLGRLTGEATGPSAVTGTLTSATSGSSFIPIVGRPFNATIWGTFTATVRLERSFDGTTWHPITAGGQAILTFTSAVSEQIEESEVGVRYRFFCSAYTSGTINYRLSQ